MESKYQAINYKSTLHSLFQADLIFPGVAYSCELVLIKKISVV